jgi:hypothetical protein
MIIKFNDGVPVGCIEWLTANIGAGNITLDSNGESIISHVRQNSDAWCYNRISLPDEHNPGAVWFVPSIEIFDEEQAAWAVLRWS